MRSWRRRVAACAPHANRGVSLRSTLRGAGFFCVFGVVLLVFTGNALVQTRERDDMAFLPEAGSPSASDSLQRESEVSGRTVAEVDD